MKEKMPMTATTQDPKPSAPTAADDPVSLGPPLQPHGPGGMMVSLGTDADEHEEKAPARTPKMRADKVSVFYGDKQALKDVSINIHDDRVTAFIGPSGCGKSTFLRCLNRMNDTIATARVSGNIQLDGEDINSAAMDVVQLRARVGMVFQKPNPFPKSIYENVAYGPRIHGLSAN